jgi:integrase
LLARPISCIGSPATIASYEMMVDVYLKPALGGAPARLTSERIGSMLSALLGRGDLSPTAVRYVNAVLRIALGHAVKAGRAARNVATLVDPPAKATHERQPLTAAQARDFIGSMEGERFGPLFVAAIGTGMRQGELLGLRWTDMDVEGAT